MLVFIRNIYSYVFLILFQFNNIILATESIEADSKMIASECKKALDFYIDRPDLETEFLRRLEFCTETARNVSPKGFEVNPIISDFKSRYGVNGRTRVNVHQGIDIIGSDEEPIIAIADGKVLETGITYCEGPSVVIDHGKSFDNKSLITIYSHTGEFMVKEGDYVKRGTPVAKLPSKIAYPCMARVRHLHLQIGQVYCEKEEKNTWGCGFYIKDLYNSLNPHDYWANGPDVITCFDENKTFKKGTLTYPFVCDKK